MKKFIPPFLLLLAATQPAAAYSAYTDDNPFVEAMLRMMEIFGLAPRSRLPLGIPFQPGYDQSHAPGLGLGGLSSGLTGLSPMNGPGTVPGLSPWSGLYNVPGMSPWSSLSGVPGLSPMSGPGFASGLLPLGGVSGVPGMSAFPGAGLPGQWAGNAWPGQLQGTGNTGLLDGVWELNKGGFVVIRGNRARLQLSRELHQDFVIGYDRNHLWWSPQTGGDGSLYRYRVRDGRMVLRDNTGNVLLLRRRR